MPKKLETESKLRGFALDKNKIIFKKWFVSKNIKKLIFKKLLNKYLIHKIKK